MHIIIERQALAHAVNQVAKAVSSRTTIPILTGIKLTMTPEECLLTGSDSDISIQASIPVEEDDREIIKVVKLGSIVLPSRYLTEIVKKLPEDEVEIEVRDQFITIIRSGQAEFNLNGLDADEYPRLPEIEENQVIQIPSDLLKTVIRQTVFAASAQESRPILTGALWQLENNQLTVVATDSHRLAQRKIRVTGDPQLSFNNVVIPGKSLQELSRLIDGETGEVHIVVTSNQIMAKANRLLFFSRLLEGTYPDISRIIPQTSKTKLIMENKQLTQAIERSILLARDGKHVVRLTTEESNMIQLTSTTPEVGRVVEHVPAQEVSGEELNISFNARYVLEALRALDSEQIQIDFTGSMSPFVIKPTDHDDIIHLVLPVRTY